MIELGDKVRCTETDFEGVVDGIATYLNGCRRISVQPTVDKKGKWREGYWIDETTLKVIEKDVSKTEKLKKRKANLGDWVKCKMTGFEGYVSAYMEYATGNRSYSVHPKVDEDGNLVDPRAVKEKDVEVTKEAVMESKQQVKGGPSTRKSSELP